MGSKKKLILVIIIFIILVIIALKFLNSDKTSINYITGDTKEISLYNESFEEIDKIIRGLEVKSFSSYLIDKTTNQKYNKIIYNNKNYLIADGHLTSDSRKVVSETKVYVRTPVSVYETPDSSHIISYIKKGEELEVLDFDSVLSDGSVNRYKIKYQDITGYIYGKYVVNSYEESILNYDTENTYKVHASRANTQGGGSAANLDYYPVEKVNIDNNVMPDEVRSLYLNAGVIWNIDKYIEIAKKGNINAFVVDIKDNTSPGYASLVMKEYSPTNYNHAINSIEKYQSAIQKLKDNGFYVIGRITAFKDNYYATDHPENTILDNVTGQPFSHNSSYWPSAYDRDVWEFNVELAKEAVTLMGFHEIQFDYVRFPDRTNSKIESNLDFQNKYGEEKAQAIQNFLFYACDEIHNVGAYVSADVFGESAHSYVSGYGQYWAAISNVVDVISGMPYPDHFNKYQYNFDKPVWTVPYDLISYWSKNYVVKQQALIPTPAKVRTWIQTYDVTWKNPKTIYDADLVSKEISALYDSGLTSGFITWNAGSSVSKYESLIPAFTKNYMGSE